MDFSHVSHVILHLQIKRSTKQAGDKGPGIKPEDKDRHCRVGSPKHQIVVASAFPLPVPQAALGGRESLLPLSFQPAVMAGRGSHIPGFSRPVTVDFIDHHLQERHPMFVNPPVQYDPTSGQYAPITERYGPVSGQYASNSQAFALGQYVSNNQALGPPPDDGNDLPPRQDWANVNAMRFWNAIFPDAMTEFKRTKEPQGRSGTDYCIRSLDSWGEIYRRLEAARAKYQQAGGPVGWLRKVRRTVADNVTPLAGAVRIGAKAAPSDPIATPVLAAVELVLNAVKSAAHVRQQAVNAFDGLIPIFSDVELFLGTFPGDVRIRKASVDLIATTLDAIERAIGFFISNELWRGTKAVLNAIDYERNMVESLGMIKTKSSSLMEEAAKSHIHEFHMFSRETQKFRMQLAQKLQSVADGTNALNNLLTEHLAQKDRELEASRRENLHLHIMNERLRAATPSQQGWWPLPPPQPPAVGPYINPEGLRRMLDTPDLDLADLAFVNDKKGQLPERERARAEQIINT
ncbi:hypothetical protein MAPG_10115 [Magnaporthiopsis poae ATCC 64411]|uniref:Fungal STAND N-terminal Goodbye domain-containing protein n=1 Tax=Magnaporthiopsis poae (strain ATCC 64411 / 73-15) TaxID=644358 RepID=A0A0C4EBR0_MAGP6|nr:hypothetical protein MAPG_10115 [Magnaporthiopsis poae ATCC 64411]